MAQEKEWLKVWGSPKSATDSGKKHLEDYLDESGRYYSTPSTPTGKTRFGREPSFDSAQQDKPNIMTKVHEKAKKWKQVLPYIKKHLHGQAHDSDQRQGLEINKGKSATTSVDLGGGNVEERDGDYLAAPMYEFETAPKLNKQQSMIQQGSVTSPPQLTRCKSYRPRPGVKAGIEEIQVQVQVHDMTRTISDPVQLKPVRLTSSEYQPTSFSFPTSPEIQELDDNEQILFNNRKLDRTRYPSSLSPRFVGNPSSLSPRLVINTQDKTPRASEARIISSSDSRMIYQNNSNEMPFTDYNIIVEEINEILDSPSSLTSKAIHKETDSTDEIQSPQDPQQYKSICQATFFSSPPELNRYNKTETSKDISANMFNNRNDTKTNDNESPTHKVLLEVAHKIADSQVVTNQELELHDPNNSLKVSFTPIETKPTISTQVSTDELDHSKFEDPRTTPFDNSNVASKVATFTRIMETTNKDIESTKKLGVNVSDQVNSGLISQLTCEILSQTSNTDSKSTDETIESSQTTVTPQPQELNSTSLAIGKLINLKPIATKLETNNPKESNENPTNEDDYKTVTEAVIEILSPAYHAVSEAANKIVESALNETKKLAKSVSDNNSSPNTDASDGGEYKTVTEAVGEMLTPVYSAVSQATNKVAGKGYQKGISFREYLKSMAVVGNTINNDDSLIRNEEVPGSPVPVSRNPYTEESDEVEGNGRRLQLSTN